MVRHGSGKLLSIGPTFSITGKKRNLISRWGIWQWGNGEGSGPYWINGRGEYFKSGEKFCDQ